MIKLLSSILTIIGLIGTGFVWFNPINDLLQRLSLLGAVGIVWLGLLLLVWRRRWLRRGLLVLPLLLMVPLILPGRAIDRDELRTDYVRRLAEFEGTKYVWGGEGRRGIDCSGLPRKAWRDALRAYGLRHADGAILRAALEQWWFDTSAKALAEGYRGFTVPLQRKGTLRTMDFPGLLPGDLAVTRNGVHVLVYAGAGKWIQADPGAERVLTLDPKSSESGWFDSPVGIHRWSLLRAAL